MVISSPIQTERPVRPVMTTCEQPPRNARIFRTSLIILLLERTYAGHLKKFAVLHRRNGRKVTFMSLENSIEVITHSEKPLALPLELHRVTDKAPCPGVQPRCRGQPWLMFGRQSDWVAPHLYAPCYVLHYQILFQSPLTTLVAAAFFTHLNINLGHHFVQCLRHAHCCCWARVIAAPKSLLIGFTLPRHHHELGEPRPGKLAKCWVFLHLSSQAPPFPVDTGEK